MKRRDYFKAMGLSGLLYSANWFTLIRGPQAVEKVYRGWFKKTSSIIGIAGEYLAKGMVVTYKDGRFYRAEVDEGISGIIITDARLGEEVEMITSGYLSLHRPDRCI